MRMSRRKLPVLLLHISFIVILAGALTTFLTSRKGRIHLRQHVPEAYMMMATGGDNYQPDRLPFVVELDSFHTTYYDGTSSPSDYFSHLRFSVDGQLTHEGVISMNHIMSVEGYRFCQFSPDADQRGMRFTVNYDPYGIAITYSGYLLLALSVILLLAGRRQSFMQLLHHPLLRQGYGRSAKAIRKWGRPLLLLLFLFLAFRYGQRWVALGTIPLTNGYETMLFAALTTLLLSLVASASRSFAAAVAIPFGALISGFILLVAHLMTRNTDVTAPAPVLNSPLLAAHVSVIMIAYTLFAFITLNALEAIIKYKVQSTLLSRLLLYPAVLLLAVGIILGAVWANVSWGSYWSWDPKEIWALITMLAYAVAFHRRSLPFLRRPLAFHLYLLFCFLCVLMTYFGVTYLLGGMHSYA